QALVLLNDPVFVEAARAIAQRMLTEAGSDDSDRIRYGFRLATAREPAPREIEVFNKIIGDERQEYKKHEDRARELLKNGEARIDPKLDKIELAAWTTAASMILNLDETITKE